MLSTGIILVVLSSPIAAAFITAAPIKQRKLSHGIRSVLSIIRDVLSSILHVSLLEDVERASEQRVRY